MSGTIKEKKAKIRKITRDCFAEYTAFSKRRKARVIGEMTAFYDYWNISR